MAVPLARDRSLRSGVVPVWLLVWLSVIVSGWFPGWLPGGFSGWGAHVLWAGPLDEGGRSADRIVISQSSIPPSRVFGASMPNRIEGILGVLHNAERRRLAQASRRAQEVGWPGETEVLGFVHADLGGQTRSYRVGVTPDRLTLFDGVDGVSGTYAIEAELCDDVLGPMLGYAGGFGPVELPVGESTPLAQPFRASPIILDSRTISERLNGGRPSQLAETTRYLPDEGFVIRLPSDYSARRPAGLLVWVSATPTGTPPEAFTRAADSLGLIMVGASNSGNGRPAVERYQLALDAVATVSRRYHVDPTRVYTSGLSGGGRICSALVACFPEVFTGAVPVVGFYTYEHVPLGDGRFVTRGYGRPKGASWRLLRDHRIAPVSGPLDFNYREIVHAVRIMRGDGLDVRLFSYEDMAHTLPTPERFEEAVGWVDAPRAEAWTDAVESAEKLLGGYRSRYGESRVDALSVGNPKQLLLERVTETAPWSAPAWEACRLLGVEGAGDADRAIPPEPLRTP